MSLDLLPLYQCHKKVAAAKILAITPLTEPAGGAEIILDLPDPDAVDVGHLSTVVDAEWLQRNPKVAVGGYFVVYVENEDKYTAYSPAAPFEQGYDLITEKVPQVPLPGKMKKYIATERGQTHNHGIIEKGTIFDYDGPRGTWMKPYGWNEGDEQAGDAEVSEPDRRQIMVALDAAGVSYFRGAKIDQLKAKLAEVQGSTQEPKE